MSKIKWVQWTSKRSGELKAFAIDMSAELKNNVLRAVNGAAVPEDAVDAKPGTPRDSFCETIINKPAKEPKAPREPKVVAPKLRIGKKTTKVTLGGKVLGEFDSDKLEAGVDAEVKLSEKTWAVYQNKKRVTMGKLAVEEVAA